MLISNCCNCDVILERNGISYKCDICGRRCVTNETGREHGMGILEDSDKNEDPPQTRYKKGYDYFNFEFVDL